MTWSHYLQLMRIENEDERSFYEIEAAREKWGVRDLSRQYNSSLYERLALSRDKDKVHRLSQEGNVITTSKDVLKDPYVLEFVGLEDKYSYSETDLENRLLDNADMFRSIIDDRLKYKVEKVVQGYSGFLFLDKNGMPLVAMHWEHRFRSMLGRYNEIYKVQQMSHCRMTSVRCYRQCEAVRSQVSSSFRTLPS